jgi:hypothetical protein
LLTCDPYKTHESSIIFTFLHTPGNQALEAKKAKLVLNHMTEKWGQEDLSHG